MPENKTLKKKQEEHLQKITTYTGIAVLIIIIAVVGYYLVANRSASSPVSPNPEAIDFQLDKQPSLGEPTAPVKIVEFADFKCPACKLFHDQVFPQLKREYLDTGQVEFFFLNFQFLGPDSTTAGIAAECIYRQNETAFWAYYQAVFENQGPESQVWATPEFLIRLVRDHVQHVADVNIEDLEQCIAQRRHLKDVEDDLNRGKSVGVTATPTFFVNKQKFVGAGPYARLRALIEQELEKSAP